MGFNNYVWLRVACNTYVGLTLWKNTENVTNSWVLFPPLKFLGLHGLHAKANHQIVL